jgi:FixJ family two-component response regulator
MNIMNMSKPDTTQIVFVVDDDEDVRRGLQALFESVGMCCEIFRSTREFLTREPPNCPSCLVLDVRLPGASGLDFQAELADARINIPIIFISGHGDIPMTVKAMKAGAVGFFTKPLREQDLLDSVNAALGSDRHRREREASVTALRARYESLTPREKDVMAMVTAGFLNKQTAAEIGLSEVTVKVHRHNVMKKLGAKSLPELVRIADALGIECKR